MTAKKKGKNKEPVSDATLMIRLPSELKADIMAYCEARNMGVSFLVKNVFWAFLRGGEIVMPHREKIGGQ